MSTPGGYGSNPPDGDNSGDKGGQPSYGQPSESGYGQPAQNPGYSNQSAGYGNQSYPQSTGYGSPGYAPPKSNNGLAIASLICGIVSILAFCLWFVSLPLGIAAIVTGFLGRKKAKLGQAGQGGLALGGLITGIIGVVLALIVLGIGLAFRDTLSECEGLTGTAQQECITRVFSGG